MALPSLCRDRWDKRNNLAGFKVKPLGRDTGATETTRSSDRSRCKGTNTAYGELNMRYRMEIVDDLPVIRNVETDLKLAAVLRTFVPDPTDPVA